MKKLEAGFTQVVVLILLIVAVLAAAVMAQQNQSFYSKAKGPVGNLKKITPTPTLTPPVGVTLTVSPNNAYPGSILTIVPFHF